MIQDNFYLKAISPAASNEWVRNPDWLPLPEITASDNRFVGLFLVFEGEDNRLSISISGTLHNVLVDWGDGTNQTVTTSTTVTKIYDYSSIIGSVSQYYDGRNYKQVIVDAIANSGTVTSFSIAGNAGANTPGKRNFADIIMSFPNLTVSYISGGNFAAMVYLERLRFLNHSILSTASWQLTFTPMLRVLEFKKQGVLSFNTKFQVMGAVDVGDFIADEANDASAFQQVFLSSNIASVGNVSGALAPNAIQMFRLCANLKKIGDVNLPVCTNANNFASDCYSLQSVGVIYAPLLTNITSFFSGCSSLLTSEFSSCANITTSTAAFAGCRNLSRLIMTGMRVGFTISGCNLTTEALNNLFTSLGTASGSQTIIVTGNPGAATCDTTIATAKGFSVTI
jgi:hypothetical protein